MHTYLSTFDELPFSWVWGCAVFVPFRGVVFNGQISLAYFHLLIFALPSTRTQCKLRLRAGDEWVKRGRTLNATTNITYHRCWRFIITLTHDKYRQALDRQSCDGTQLPTW